MTLGSFYFKSKAKEALKGNWQTALVVTFFAGIFSTLSGMLESVAMPNIMNYAAYNQLEQYLVELGKVSTGIWTLSGVLYLLTFICTPALTLGCNHYFISRLRGQELGVEGLISRRKIFAKALWLHVIMAVRIFLWSLLFVIPGVIATIRYRMAPYYMAENPEMTAMEAIEKSKNAMANMKMSYFMLELSFFGWTILSMVVGGMLMDMNTILGLVATQLMSLMVATYINASVASFYLTVSNENGMSIAQREVESKMRAMGFDVNESTDTDAKDEENRRDDD